MAYTSRSPDPVDPAYRRGRRSPPPRRSRDVNGGQGVGDGHVPAVVDAGVPSVSFSLFPEDGERLEGLWAKWISDGNNQLSAAGNGGASVVRPAAPSDFTSFFAFAREDSVLSRRNKLNTFSFGGV